jgi:hypothetical protein
LNARFLQRIFNFVQFERFDDGLNFLHYRLLTFYLTDTCKNRAKFQPFHFQGVIKGWRARGRYNPPIVPKIYTVA